jgi:hypothetical protein
MGGYCLTGLGNATARTDAAAAGQVQDASLTWCGAAGGTADAITLTPTPAVAAYATGAEFVFVAASNSTSTTPTAAISGLAAKTIQKNGGALSAGDIVAGRIYRVRYDGTNLQLAGYAPQAAEGASMVLLGTGTTSGSASIAFTSGIDSTYDCYIIEYDNLIPATNGVQFVVTVSADAGSSYLATAYKWARWAVLDSAASGAEGSTNDGAFKPCGTVGITNNSGRGIAGQLKLYNPSSSAIFKQMRAETDVFDGSNHYSFSTGGAYYGAGTALNAIKFAFSSGNIASGNFRLYGLRKS